MPPSRLPALSGLRAFEAFARTGSMTAAANELGVTHGAVSRGIRALQLQIGAALVEGPRHQLRLTAAGRRLAEATGAAFAQIAEALPGATTGEELYLSCYGTFAMKWLIPRLPDFLASRPGARIRIVEEHGPVDFARGHVQAAIRMDDAIPAGARFVRFMPQYHGPVLSPQVWEACGRDRDATLRLPRLVSETFLGSWEEWAKGHGAPLPDPPPDSSTVQVFEHNSYMLEAAVAGLGMAIAPWSFAEADIAQGRLMAPFGFRELPMRFAFIQPGAGDNPLPDALGKWLQRQGRVAARPPNL
jgi:DNA-binding transcriptional LysR family regulator